MALTITKPTVGGDAGVWGTELNTALDAIVTAVNAISSLTPTAVKTGSYTAAAGDLVPYDLSGGNGTLTLPTAPADKTVIATKVIALSGSNSLTINTGGSDVFNKTGGATTANLPTLNQMYVLRYQATGAIWFIEDNLSLGSLDSRFFKVSNNLSEGTAATMRTNLAVPPSTRLVSTTGAATGGGDLSADRTINVPQTNRVVLTGSGNYTPTTGCTAIRVEVVGPGAGGAGGYRAASGSVCPGGGAGGGGGYSFGTFLVSDLTIPVPYVVGTGGTGGAGATADNSAGAAGGAASGGSLFGTVATTDYYLQAGRGSAGGAPTSSAGGAAGSAGTSLLTGGNGGAGSAGVSAGVVGANAAACGGGGGGGGVTTTPSFLAGGNGGTTNIINSNAAAGGATDGAAGAVGVGRAVSSHTALPSSGGGGGAGSVASTGGAGGNGGFPGGGGGGGGGSTNTHASGVGGNGANGIIVITEYF